MTSPRNRSGRCLGVEVEPDQLSRLHSIARERRVTRRRITGSLDRPVAIADRRVATGRSDVASQAPTPLEHSHIPLYPVEKCRF